MIPWSENLTRWKESAKVDTELDAAVKSSVVIESFKREDSACVIPLSKEDRRGLINAAGI
jgi:hypothetical protein